MLPPSSSRGSGWRLSLNRPPVHGPILLQNLFGQALSTLKLRRQPEANHQDQQGLVRYRISPVLAKLDEGVEWFFLACWFAKGCKKAVERPQPKSVNIFQECLDNRPLAGYHYQLLCKVISLQSKLWKDPRGRQEKPRA